jgi:arsenite methyltransferase
MTAPTTPPVDVERLRDEIRKTYTDVSDHHDQEFIFPTGRTWAQELGIPSRSSRACPM